VESEEEDTEKTAEEDDDDRGRVPFGSSSLSDRGSFAAAQLRPAAPTPAEAARLSALACFRRSRAR
jgi:hypothetical protein